MPRRRARHEDYNVDALVMDIGPVMPQEEQRAWVAKLPSLEARNALLEGNMRFIFNVARQYQGSGLPIPDLIQEGAAGFIKAIDRFDPSCGVTLITYGVWWIRQSIVKALQTQSRTVRVPINKLKSGYRREFGLVDANYPKSIEDMYYEETWQEARQPSHHPLSKSLNHPVFGDNPEDWIERLGDGGEAAEEIEGLLEHEDRENLVAQLMGHLTHREARVLALYFGFGSNEAMTLEEVGLALGVTRERIRQIKEKALARCKAFLRQRIAA